MGLDSPRNDEDVKDKVVVDKKRKKRITKDWKVDFEDPEESVFNFTRDKTFEIELPTSKVLVEIKALSGREENFLSKANLKR